MNKIKAIVIGAMMSVTMTACAAGNITAIHGEVGKYVKLSLESNPTTGYSWMIKSLPEGLIFVSGTYQQAKECKKGMTGCGGEETFRFIGEKAGEGTLKLIYGQPFDKSGWQEKDVKVVISKAP